VGKEFSSETLRSVASSGPLVTSVYPVIGTLLASAAGALTSAAAQANAAGPSVRPQGSVEST
jgi:hypothetical protein